VDTRPPIAIGQRALVVQTPGGNVMWDCISYVDDESLAAVRERGGLSAIALSHPHFYACMVQWSEAFRGCPIYIHAADGEWVQYRTAALRLWAGGTSEILPGVTLSQPGGHFPGSAVAHWQAGAQGRGVLLTGDTIFANPDRTSVSFMRSYPNRLPLSGAVVKRVADHVDRFDYDRLYGNFDNSIEADAKAIVHRSAERHAAWVSGDYDHLT